MKTGEKCTRCGRGRWGNFLDDERGSEKWLDPDALQCSSSRIVAHDGVYACPILVGEPEARLADDLEGGLRDCSLYHSSCHTCYVTGMTCKNF